MPIEIGVWRIDGKLQRIAPVKLDLESRLEEALHTDISLIRDDLWVIGRQVQTKFGHFIDLLALDADGKVVVVELKRDKTPREVVAQVLDYALWVKGLSRDDIVRIYEDHARKLTKGPVAPFDEAFAQRFGVETVPETINDGHELVIVAAELDESTERIVQYLSDEEYGVPLNAVFFRVFKDGDREYRTRSWLLDPSQVEAASEEATARKRGKEPWNGRDLYVSFGNGESRNWDDARKYGFVSAGGGAWYTRSMKNLQPGNRVFVHVPGHGYVGVGRVTAVARRADQATVTVDGSEVPLAKVAVGAKNMLHDKGDDALAETVVGVEWLKAVGLDSAFWTDGLFANQNSACKLRSRFTVEKVAEHFGVQD
ncbi:MAG: DUF91 domain-containing protein [Myxococcaceae bacterium]|nr:DUF91 domain-containing protein [Myxococcaceae bacterium]